VPIQSNCIAQALREFRRRVAAWQVDPTQHEPYLLVRPSRHPGGVLHMLVGELDTTIDAVRVESFKPVAPVRHPWWKPPLRFRGQWVAGDTKPAPLDELGDPQPTRNSTR